MRRLVDVATSLLLLVALSSAAYGQDPARRPFLGSPVFVFQPGLVTTNIIDAPEGAEAETDFNFRLVTAIPTSIPRTSLVAIVQWLPFKELEGGFGVNAPAFVYGPVFNIFNLPMVSLDFDVLGAFSPSADEEPESMYTHKLVLEGDLFFKIGQIMMPEASSRWRNLSLYVLLAYVATGIPSEASPWAILWGLSLPIAP